LHREKETQLFVHRSDRMDVKPGGTMNPMVFQEARVERGERDLSLSDEGSNKIEPN